MIAFNLKEPSECPEWRGFWSGKGNRDTKAEGMGLELAGSARVEVQGIAYMWKGKV